MADNLFETHVQAGTHAARPAATAVPPGSLYACTDHTIVYQSDGSAWSNWHDPTGLASGGGEALANEWVGVGHPMLHSSVSQALNANRIYLAKYSPRVDVTVDTANIYINTSAGNLDLGIYNADLSSLLASTGSFASPGTGHRTQAFSGAASVAMDAGTIYYLAMMVSSTSFRCPTFVPSGAYTTGWNIIGREDAGSMPLPASIAAADGWEDGFVMPLFYFTT